MWGFTFKAILLFAVVIGCEGNSTPKVCNEVMREWEGQITTPNYPDPFPSGYSCNFFLVPPETETTLLITIQDLDLQQNVNCIMQSQTGTCCTKTWLSVPSDDLSAGVRTTFQLCGRNDTQWRRSFYIGNPRDTVSVKFFSSGKNRGNKGFHLTYKYTPLSKLGCQHGDILCDRDKCVRPAWRCDGYAQCIDGTDESYCLPDEKHCTGLNEASCGRLDRGCFNNKTQRCDGRRDCRRSGLDEDGCEGCAKGSMPCVTHGCYRLTEICDGVPNCPDFSDEADCGYCPPGQALCSLQSPQCFSPFIDQCNGKLDCPYGEDEVDCDPGCRKGIACADGQGCYTSSERCNLVLNCADGSDELHCQREVHFECETGGNSIAAHMWCDGVDDCGDGSDEQGCIRNSIITAAIMGSLMCGLLLVIAVGCTCRLYSMSLKGACGSGTTNNSTSSSCNSTSSGNNNNTTGSSAIPVEPMSAHLVSPRSCAAMPPLTLFAGEEEFYYREPPPAYSVAMGESVPPPCPYPYTASPNIAPTAAAAAGRRRIRRMNCSRRLSPHLPTGTAPQLPVEGVALPPYAPAPPGSLPPYTPLDPDAGVALPAFAPPPSVKVMESLLQSVASIGPGCSDGASDSVALVGEIEPLAPPAAPYAPRVTSNQESAA